MAGLVVCIQDLHANPSVQRSIAATIDVLVGVYGFRHIFTEGTWGPIDSSVMKLFPDARIKKEALDYFLNKGELTGQEYAVCMRPEIEIAFVGVDDQRLYTDNKTAGAAIAKVREWAMTGIERLVSALAAKCEGIVSRDLWNLTELCRSFDAGRIDEKTYLSQLYWYSRVSGVPIVGALRRRMRAEEIVRTNDDPPSKPSSEDDNSDEQCREDLEAKLSLTDVDHRYRRILGIFRMLADAFQAKLTADQARKFLGVSAGDARSGFNQDIEFLAMCLESSGSDLGTQLRESLTSLDFLWTAWNTPTQFYRTAKARSHFMAEKTADEMRSGSVDRAILVVGGFHASTCCRDLLKQHGVACVMVMPAMDSVQAPNYWRIIEGNLLTTEEILADAQRARSG
jgi:hypothetical protein